MIFRPHDYQREAIDFLSQNQHAALFADPGLGKTGILLSLIDQFFWTADTLCPALIIAPLRVAQTVWTGEIAKFCTSFGYLRCAILHGPKKEQRLQGEVDLYLLNVENVFWALGKRKFRSLIIDESSRFKNPKAKRFRALRKFLKFFERRYILTGTPAPKSIMDLWCQQYLVDQGESLGQYITHYRDQYFDAVGYRGFTDWTPKKGASEAVQIQMAPTTFRLDAADHLDLPEIVYNVVKIDLPTKIRKFYNALEKEFFAELDETEVLVNSSAELYNRCCQCANGRMYNENEILDLHSAKIDAVKEIIGELQGKPVLIAYHYKHDLAQLLSNFKEAVVLRGSADTDKLVTEWNRGEIPILVGHPASMGFGLNLQKGGHDIIWFAPPDNLESYIQFNQRIWRQGVTGQVRVHLIVAENTIDKAKLVRLNQKNQNQVAFLNALKQYRKGRKENKWVTKLSIMSCAT